MEQTLNLLSDRASASDRFDPTILHRRLLPKIATDATENASHPLLLLLHRVSYMDGVDDEKRRRFARLLSDLPGLHELVDVLVGGQHRLILLQALILARVRAVRVELFALDTVLTVLGGLHVPEEAQHVGVVAARLPQLVQLPRQLSGHQVRVGRVPRWVPVHRAYRVLPAALRVVAETREHGVEARQQGRVERVIVGEEKRTRRDLVEDLQTNKCDVFRVFTICYCVRLILWWCLAARKIKINQINATLT